MYKILSCAKINLFLAITGRRTDGYHFLYSLFIPINSLNDTLYFKDSNHGVNSTYIVGNLVEDTIVKKTLDHMQQKYNLKKCFDVRIEKNIPIGGGLGGGSSNAASTLHAINLLCKLHLSTKQLIKEAAQIGADVPFFLIKKPSIVSGIGEIISPCTVKKYHILLVNPGINISTAEIFAGYRQAIKEFTQEESIIHLTPDQLCVIGRNDLLPIVQQKYPIIFDLIEDIKLQNGCYQASISGSGSTCFGLFESSLLLEKAKQHLKNKYPNFWFHRCGNC